jgi:serine/threonine protein kinase
LKNELLTFFSPEQTGRISKPVDFRSDIYSLGITFYQFLTGNVPFSGLDKMSLVHSHITKKLPKVEDVPNAINDILQKMTAKNSNERYSSVSGVQKDLKFCLEHFENLSNVNFICGMNQKEKFQIPNKLYGRDEELFLLRSFINSEDSKMCCVSGFSGAGKSKLIEELYKDQNNNLLMVFGKYDQFDRSTPYSAFIK